MVAAEAELVQNDNPVEVPALGPNIMTLCSCVMAFFCSSVYLSEKIKHCKTVVQWGGNMYTAFVQVPMFWVPAGLGREGLRVQAGPIMIVLRIDFF